MPGAVSLLHKNDGVSNIMILRLHRGPRDDYSGPSDFSISSPDSSEDSFLATTRAISRENWMNLNILLTEIFPVY